MICNCFVKLSGIWKHETTDFACTQVIFYNMTKITKSVDTRDLEKHRLVFLWVWGEFKKCRNDHSGAYRIDNWSQVLVYSSQRKTWVPYMIQKQNIENNANCKHSSDTTTMKITTNTNKWVPCSCNGDSRTLKAAFKMQSKYQRSNADC